jgi:hypothetical protein
MENSRLEEKLRVSNSECERASHEIKRLNHKLEETVKNCMMQSPMMSNFPSKGLVNNIGGKVAAAKGKDIMIISKDDPSEITTSEESRDHDMDEVRKRKLMARSNVPPPRSYRRAKEAPNQITLLRRLESRFQSKIGEGTSGIKKNLPHQSRGKKGHISQRLTSVQFQKEQHPWRANNAESS